MTHRKLIRGGIVLTMDPGIGDLPTGDVLIEGDEILQVGTDLEAGTAEVVDATGRIVTPGFVDTHRHTWEAAIRTSAPDATLDDYFVEILDTFAPRYEPEDVLASNRAGAMECLNAGITTLVDWSHINNTPEHSDAAVQGLRESGIRAQYAYGCANTSIEDYWVDSSITMPRDEIERIRSTYFSSDDGLLTMALATRGPGFCQDDVVRAEWAMARELDLPITVHVGQPGALGMVTALRDLGLLGPDTTYIHCCLLDDEEWQLIRDTGGTVSVAAQIEMQMGHGEPPVARAIAEGLRPSLSIDVVTSAPGDMFTPMRAAFATDRRRAHTLRREHELDAPEGLLSARDLLEIATINGAHAAGLGDVTGSITPGKKADLILFDATAPNTAPVMDPVATVVLAADTANVETVLVGGEYRKRDGRLTGDWDRARRDVVAARDRLVSKVEPLERWTALHAG